MTTEPPVVATVKRRISAIKAERLKDLQLRLFPELPDDRRAAPNAVVRSSVSAVVRRGKWARVTEKQVAAPEGWEIAITGWRLDQHDLDIWLEITQASYGRPERLLDPAVRRAHSSWGFVSDDVQARSMRRLAEDLDSGAWDKRYGSLRGQLSYNRSLRSIVSQPMIVSKPTE